MIPLLDSDFYVVCVSYDGFDETEQTVFPDMLTETGKMEQYIQDHFGGHICAAYGFSLGGSFVDRLYYEKMLDMFGVNNTRISFVQKRSISNQFYSDLITPLQKDVSHQSVLWSVNKCEGMEIYEYHSNNF